MIDNAITILATGVSAATGGASARSPIPPTSSGALPNFIRVSGRNECYVKVGNSTVVATGNDALVQPADSLLLRVAGNTHIAYIQGTAAGQINVVPLDDV